jgi:hypothetical protein
LLKAIESTGLEAQGLMAATAAPLLLQLAQAFAAVRESSKD